MDEIDRMAIDSIRFHGRRYKMTEEEIETLVDMYASLPLINAAPAKEMQEALKKCENMNK